MSQGRTAENGKENAKEEGDEFQDEDEMFMALTPQDKAAWEKMMRSRIESLKKNHAEFQKWRDNMSRRRMFVYSRIRKLNAAQKDRLRFVLKMAETVKIARDVNNNKEDVDGSNNRTDAGKDETSTNGAEGTVTDAPNSTPENNTIRSDAEVQEGDAADDSTLPSIVVEKEVD